MADAPAGLLAIAQIAGPYYLSVVKEWFFATFAASNAVVTDEASTVTDTSMATSTVSEQTTVGGIEEVCSEELCDGDDSEVECQAVTTQTSSGNTEEEQMAVADAEVEAMEPVVEADPSNAAEVSPYV